MNHSTKSVLIYRDIILPSSETFIKEQGQGLERYNSYYIGSRKVEGLKEVHNQAIVINKGTVLGRFRELAFKLLEIPPLYIVNHLKRTNPKLIHAHFGPDGLLAIPIAEKLNIPLLITFHGYDATVKNEYSLSYSHKKYLNNKQKVIKKAKIIAVSNFIKEKLIDDGYSEDNIIQHYIGIDTKKFIPDPKIARKPIVLFVGRLVEKKGLEYLIKAMKKVQAFSKDTELVVIGDGPLREKMEELARKNLRNYRFLGAQPSEEVKRWMNVSKIFSVPSIVAENGDAEGFGMVFAEANAMGLPVVSYKTGGIVEAVSHNETGFLLEEKDVDGLSFKIIELLKDELLWKKFSENGMKRVEELYNLKHQNKKLEKIYDELILSYNQ